MPTVFDVDNWWDEEQMWCGLHAALDPVRVPFLVGALEGMALPRVLDVGCGGGFLLRALAEHDARPIGVDVSAQALEAASAVTGALIRADGARLPFASDSFDGVVLSEVLEHVPDPMALILEAARITRHGGVLMTSVPNRTLRSRLALIDLAQRFPVTRVLPRDLHEWARFIRPRELIDRLEGAGFRVEAVQGIGIPLRRLPSAAVAWSKLRRGATTFAAAGRTMRLGPVRSTALAYMVRARRHAA